MYPSRGHSARRTRRLRLGAGDGHLTHLPGPVDGVDDSVSGQVEQHARSLTRRARSLDHGSWSFFWIGASATPISAQGHEPFYTGSITSKYEEPTYTSRAILQPFTKERHA